MFPTALFGRYIKKDQGEEMQKYICEYDKTDVVEELIQVLEITGNNPHINKLQDESHKILVKYLENFTNTNLLISVIIELRKRARIEIEKDNFLFGKK